MILSLGGPISPWNYNFRWPLPIMIHRNQNCNIRYRWWNVGQIPHSSSPPLRNWSSLNQFGSVLWPVSISVFSAVGEFQAVRTRHSELAFSIEQIIILNNNLLVRILRGCGIMRRYDSYPWIMRVINAFFAMQGFHQLISTVGDLIYWFKPLT